MAIDGSRFGALAQTSTNLVAALRSSDAVDGQKVVAPGDPEKIEMAARLKDGVPVDSATWKRLAELAAEVGVDVPPTLGG